MLYVDIYIRIYSLPFEEKHPKSHFQMICLMLIKKTFGLFLCPHLLLVATRWHWRACKWTLCGVKFITSPGLCGTEEIKKNLCRVLFLSHRQVRSQMLLQNRRQRKNTEKSKQEQELLQNLTRIERCNGGQTGKKREEKERDSEKCEKSEKETD